MGTHFAESAVFLSSPLPLRVRHSLLRRQQPRDRRRSELQLLAASRDEPRIVVLAARRGFDPVHAESLDGDFGGGAGGQLRRGREALRNLQLDGRGAQSLLLDHLDPGRPEPGLHELRVRSFGVPAHHDHPGRGGHDLLSCRSGPDPVGAYSLYGVSLVATRVAALH